MVGRRVEATPIPAGQCRARRAAVVTEHIAVVSQVAAAPILHGQCQAHLVEAADTTALPRAADRAEATPEADHMAALLVADTVTTK